LSLPPVEKRIPFAIAYAAGAVLETTWSLSHATSEPPMTRFLAQQLARSHSYDTTPAERDFGHRELVPMDVATDRLVAALQAERTSAIGTRKETRDSRLSPAS
jgi:hypothetical protein